jgi:hypothetical protein
LFGLLFEITFHYHSFFFFSFLLFWLFNRLYFFTHIQILMVTFVLEPKLLIAEVMAQESFFKRLISKVCSVICLFFLRF